MIIITFFKNLWSRLSTFFGSLFSKKKDNIEINRRINTLMLREKELKKREMQITTLMEKLGNLHRNRQEDFSKNEIFDEKYNQIILEYNELIDPKNKYFEDNDFKPHKDYSNFDLHDNFIIKANSFMIEYSVALSEFSGENNLVIKGIVNWPLNYQDFGSKNYWNKLKTLTFFDTQLEYLNHNSFEGLTKLKSLFLISNNLLKSISDKTLQGLNISYLCISASPYLTKLSDSLLEPIATSLEKLTIHKTGLSSLSPNFFNNLLNLSEITLEENHLTALPEKAQVNLPSLKKMTVIGNNLQSKFIPWVENNDYSKNITFSVEAEDDTIPPKNDISAKKTNKPQ